jgi:hypothetical protein
MKDDNDMNEEVIESLGIKAIHYNNLVDRYFTKYYVDKDTEKEQYIFIHTNGIVMCGLGSNHYLVKSGAKIEEVKDLNKMTKVSGKRKHGAHILNDNEYILEFVVRDDNILLPTQEHNIKLFSFSAKVKGKLVEINSNLFKDPTIIQKSPEKNGYLCFILLNDNRSIDALKQRLENTLNK